MSDSPQEATALLDKRVQLSEHFLLLQPPTKLLLKTLLWSGRHLPRPTRPGQKPLSRPHHHQLSHLFSCLSPHCPGALTSPDQHQASSFLPRAWHKSEAQSKGSQK